MPSMTPFRDWTVAQHFAIWIGLFTTVTGLIGLVMNPDFAVGNDATLPGLAIPYLAYRAITDAAVGIWAALDDRPLGVLFLPTSSDAILHAVIAGVSALGLLLAARGSRRAAAAA